MTAMVEYPFCAGCEGAFFAEVLDLDTGLPVPNVVFVDVHSGVLLRHKQDEKGEFVLRQHSAVDGSLTRSVDVELIYGRFQVVKKGSGV